MELTIRPERPADYPSIYRLVQAAFAGSEHTDGDEQNLVERLRRTPDYIPALSLVALDGETPVGHILFSRIRVGEDEALALAPLAVLPAYQGRGVGSALVEAGHRAAAGLGYTHSIVLGHPGYYPRFGYRPAAPYGILCPFDAPEDAFLAVNLLGEPVSLRGMVTYGPAFG